MVFLVFQFWEENLSQIIRNLNITAHFKSIQLGIGIWIYFDSSCNLLSRFALFRWIYKMIAILVCSITLSVASGKPTFDEDYYKIIVIVATVVLMLVAFLHAI